MRVLAQFTIWPAPSRDVDAVVQGGLIRCNGLALGDRSLVQRGETGGGGTMTRAVRGALAFACALAASHAQAVDIFAAPEIPLPDVAEAAAFGGNAFMAVRRCGAGICASRIAAAEGAVEDHLLVTTLAEPTHVRIAFDGTNFLVVWAETRLRPDIYAARIRPDGANLDPGGFVVSQTAMPVWYGPLDPYVAFDGIQFIVTWTEFSNRSGAIHWSLYQSRISAAGEVLDPEGTEAGDFQTDRPWEVASEAGMTVAETGTNHFSGGIREVPFDRFDPTRLITVGGMPYFSDLDLSIGNGSALLVFNVWPGSSYTILNGISHRTVFWAEPDPLPIGYLLAPQLPGRLMYLPNGHDSMWGGRPLATFDGENHVLLWAEGGSVFGVRLAPTGDFIGALEFVGSGMPQAFASNLRGVSLVVAGTSARLLVSRFDVAVGDALAAAGLLVNALDPAVLKNSNLKVALTNKLTSVGNLIDSNQYDYASAELASAISKTDGCAVKWTPDSDDWIKSCDSQRGLYSTLTWVRDLVASRL